MDTIISTTEQAQEQAQPTAQEQAQPTAQPKAKAKRKAKAQATAQEQAAAKLKALLDAKVAKALEGITPEMAAAQAQERAARLSQGAAKAWATRRANGNNGSESAKAAWTTRRAIWKAMADLAAQAQAKPKGKRKAG